MDKPFYDAVGRRKESVARVRLTPGSGLVQINGRSVHDYFKRQALLAVIQQPFQITQTTGSYDVKASVRGGGVSGQAGLQWRDQAENHPCEGFQVASFVEDNTEKRGENKDYEQELLVG